MMNNNQSAIQIFIKVSSFLFAWGHQQVNLGLSLRKYKYYLQAINFLNQFCLSLFKLISVLC
jgi:hypothetical protein